MTHLRRRALLAAAAHKVVARRTRSDRDGRERVAVEAALERPMSQGRSQLPEAIMDMIDYASEASLFYSKSGRSRQKSLVFRRFDVAAEAIRFAIEELSPKILDGCSLEVNEAHFFGREIRPLYDDGAFPLRRREK